MLNEFEAVYENGILRPLVPLSLAEQEHVKVTVTRSIGDEWLDKEFMDACADESDPTVTLELVRSSLAKIRGSMDEAIQKDRGDY